MFTGGKTGWCVGLTNLLFSCADCLQILDPGTLRSSPALYRDCFTVTCTLYKQILPQVGIRFMDSCSFLVQYILDIL
jgi:hypothetical protein